MCVPPHWQLQAEQAVLGPLSLAMWSTAMLIWWCWAAEACMVGKGMHTTCIACASGSRLHVQMFVKYQGTLPNICNRPIKGAVA
jgi:hypothetical protein